MKKILNFKADPIWGSWTLGFVDAVSTYFFLELILKYGVLEAWKFWLLIGLLIVLNAISGRLFQDNEKEVQKWEDFYKRNHLNNDQEI